MTLTAILGGTRSGKSRLAESLLTDHAVTYVAPGRRPDGTDPEWDARVAAHRAARPTSWTTVETGDLEGVLAGGTGPVLIDCLGTWLTGVVDEAGSWDDLDAAREIVRDRVGTLLPGLRAAASGRDIVIVTNEIGWGLVPLDPSGRFFADELGRLNAAVAAIATRVLLVVAGRVLDLTESPVVP